MAKTKLWNKFETIVFIVDVALIILSAYIIINFNSSEELCPNRISTVYQLLTSITCNYGVMGLIIFILTIGLFFYFITHLVNKEAKKINR
jgi:hypothetical protein